MNQYSPREIAERFLKHISERNIDALEEFMHPDVVMTFPFTPPNYPAKFEGLSEGIAFMKSFFVRLKRFSWVRADIYLTDNPEVVFINAKSECELLTGAPYGNEYVIKLVIRDGKLIDYCDYCNPAPISAAFG